MQPKVAVSACLVGHQVRHDGRMWDSGLLIPELNSFVEIIPFCPEVEIGLGTPRPATRLVNRNGNTRLECTSKSNRDLTQEMVKFAQLKSDFFISIQVSGIIFKQSSTSCGIDHVVVHHTDGVVDSQLNGQGMFTKIFTTLYPYIPVIDEGKLEKSSLAKNFLSRVEMMQKWWLMYDKGWTLDRVRTFHRENDMLIHHWNPDGFRKLKVLLDNYTEDEYNAETLAFNYITIAQQEMSILPSSIIKGDMIFNSNPQKRDMVAE